jgi:hypothetical protein|tara:strand:+ start:179 stop:1600 length:1422 start_codon:yes stop_codon:yes gene_type:complete
MKRNKQKSQRILGGLTVLVFLLVSLALPLVYPSSSNAQTQTEIVTGQETSPNYIPEMGDHTRSGGTKVNTGTGTSQGCKSGNFCTAGKQGPGGTYSSTFDLEENMTIDQINRGFTMDYGMDVDSHVSNSTLASCVNGNVMQNSDCRDIFKLTVKLFDGTVQKHSFIHEVELDFTGERNFSFSQTIPQNTYSSLTGTWDMFGIDAGFGSRFFGPAFDAPFLTTTFDLVTIIETEIIDVLNTTDILDTNVPEPVEITNIEVEVEAPSGQQMATLEMEVQTEMTMEMPAEMAPPTETATTEPEIEVAEVNTEIEAEMQNEPTTSESSTEAEPQGRTESSNESEPESTEADGEEPRTTETASTEESEETQSESSSVKPKAKVAKKTSAKQKAARKIVKKMGDKGKYDSQNQLKTLIVMTVLGNSKKFLVQPTIPQPTGFFTDSKMPDARLPENNVAAWILMGGSNQRMNELVDSQYK